MAFDAGEPPPTIALVGDPHAAVNEVAFVQFQDLQNQHQIRLDSIATVINYISTITKEGNTTSSITRARTTF